jgi:hypothetical protein
LKNTCKVCLLWFKSPTCTLIYASTQGPTLVSTLLPSPTEFSPVWNYSNSRKITVTLGKLQ